MLKIKYVIESANDEQEQEQSAVSYLPLRIGEFTTNPVDSSMQIK